MESLLEIQTFMKIDSRLDLKSLAVTDVLGKFIKLPSKI